MVVYYIRPHVKQIANGNLQYDCDNLGGSERVGGGREVQERGDICVPMADSW